MAASGAAGAAAAAARMQAIRASGVLVRLDPEEFQRLVDRHPEPLVVSAPAGLFGTKTQYLTSYKGLAFWCRSATPLYFAKNAELMAAASIMIPG
ncbi:MAG: hypothetical protein U0794_08070 [Isosphaeraceae bacterium]